MDITTVKAFFMWCTIINTGLLFLSSLAFVLIGSTARNAGIKVTEYTNAAITPIATIFPRSLNGGASEKFIVRKPIAVVTLVRKIGRRLTLSDSEIASCLLIPIRIWWNIVASI